VSDPLTPSTEGDRTCAHCGYINLADNCPGCGEPYWSEPAAPAEGLESLRLVYDAKHDDREFVSGWNGALDAVAALKPAAPAECPGCTEQPHIPPCPFARP